MIHVQQAESSLAGLLQYAHQVRPNMQARQFVQYKVVCPSSEFYPVNEISDYQSEIDYATQVFLNDNQPQSEIGRFPFSTARFVLPRGITLGQYIAYLGEESDIASDPEINLVIEVMEVPESLLSLLLQ